MTEKLGSKTVGTHTARVKAGSRKVTFTVVKKGRYLFCPQGSHFDLYDDQSVYMTGVIQFIRDVDAARF